MKELLIHSYIKTKYYKELFDKVGFNPYKMEKFSDIEIIPVQTKQDYRKNFENVKSVNFLDINPGDIELRALRGNHSKYINRS